MVALGINEEQAFEICKKYDMLSPLYYTGIGRDGCFFCPNAGKKERELLETQYPELVRKIYDIIAKTNCQTVLRLKNRNNWVKDYLENNGDFERKPEITTDSQLNGQMSIYDYLNESEGWYDKRGE